MPLHNILSFQRYRSSIDSSGLLNNTNSMVAAFCLLIMPVVVGADEYDYTDLALQSGWTLTVENDLMAGEDSRYTNGIALFYGEGLFSRFTPENTPKLLHGLIGNSFINRDSNRERAIVYGFYQIMLTPEDITVSELQKDDVPYAGVLAGEAHFYSIADKISDRLSFTIGVIGPLAFARESQKAVHAVIGSDDPRGWRHQIKNEPIAMAELQRSWRAWDRTNRKNIDFDVIITSSAALGNFRSDVSGTLVARLGQNLIDSFATASVSPNRQVNPMAFSQRRTWDLFAGIKSSYIANEIFTNGNTFKKSHSVKLNPYRVQVSAGVGWNMGNWAFVLVASDFLGNRNADPFGSFSITRRTR